MVDTPDSFILLQYGTPPSGAGSDHALAFRYDTHAAPMWPEAVDLGAVPRVPESDERLVATRLREGVVRTTVHGGGAIELGSSGKVSLP